MFNILRDDPQLAEEHIRRLPPYTNPEIRDRLAKALVKAAEAAKTKP